MIGNVMLVTACPECKTTFRITVGILEKAGGQVRCGRCARIFDANAELREIDESRVEFKPSADFKFELQPDTEIDSLAEPFEEARETGEDETEPEAPGPEVAGPGALEPEREAADDVPPPDDGAPDWLAPIAGTGPPRTWVWAAGTAAAALLMLGQLVHHYRSELVAVPAIGPVLAWTYAGLGAAVLPSVDLDQFELLDLTAVAEPSGDEEAWLVIETRVVNQGPKVQPYPHILVRLLDRWEDTIAARYFAPEEYAVTSVRDSSRMNVGSAVDAQFIIMDPGPSATGFELELCAKSQRGFECESDDAE